MQNKIYLISFITLIGFPLLAVLTNTLFPNPLNFYTLTQSPTHLSFELLIGTILGSIFGLVALSFVQHNKISKRLTKYTDTLKRLKLNISLIILMSLSAGIGEELFFRGVLQNYLGIIPTSIFFVAIHGYLNPKNIWVTCYGILLTCFTILISWSAVHVGMISAIIAHASFDFILLSKLRQLD